MRPLAFSPMRRDRNPASRGLPRKITRLRAMSQVEALMPAVGPLLYLALGVNRIRRRALLLGVHKTTRRGIPEDLGEPEHEGAEHLKLLARVVSRVVNRPLTPGNHVQPLVNGDEAFPAMLAAIESAKHTISMVSYIFDNDASGKLFR